MKRELTLREEYFGYLLYDNHSAWYHSIRDEVAVEGINSSSNGNLCKNVIDYLLKHSVDTYGAGIRIIRRKMTDHLSAPLEMYFDYTSECNLNCPQCYNRESLNYNTMDKNTITKIIDEMYELGIMRLHLAGGEPIFHEDLFFHYIDVARKNGIVTSMATNGTLITSDIADALLDRNIYSVSVSIDGFDELSNRKTRGNNNFLVAKNGLQNLITAKEKIGANTDICLKPMFFPTSSIAFFENMIQFAISLGADKIKFSNPERTIYHEKGYWDKNKDLYYSQMEQLCDLKAKHDDKIRIDVINSPCNHKYTIGLPNQLGCIGANELLTINPSGDITPCLMHKRVLGNYYKIESLKQFLDTSHTLRSYIAELKSNNSCTTCHLLDRCRGGCQVRKLVDYGHLSAPDPLCPLKYDDQAVARLDKQDVKNDSEDFEKIYIFHSL